MYSCQKRTVRIVPDVVDYSMQRNNSEYNIDMGMREKIEEPERLERFLQEIRDKSQEFKALIIKLCYEINDVERVSELTNVPISTIYDWLEEWNKKKNIL